MMDGMSQRITAQISQEEAAVLDEAVASGRFPSRAAAVRAGIAALLAEDDVEVVDAEIVAIEPAPLPQRPDWSPVLDVARRAALPVVTTGAAALATRALLRRRRTRTGPSPQADLRRIVVVLRRL